MHVFGNYHRGLVNVDCFLSSPNVASIQPNRIYVIIRIQVTLWGRALEAKVLWMCTCVYALRTLLTPSTWRRYAHAQVGSRRGDDDIATSSINVEGKR